MLLLCRNIKAIEEAFLEFAEKVRWDCHQKWLNQFKTSQEQLTEEEQQHLERVKQDIQRAEEKYGRKNLGWRDFERGLLCGRMSALAWVMGAEWDDSLDV